MGLLVQSKDARFVDRDTLTSIAAPTATSSWCPIAHGELLELVESLLPRYDLGIQDAAYGISHDDHRFFGILQVKGPDGEFSRVIGIRNSTDKRFPAGVCAGVSVTVCSNLVFSGTIQISRKHTVFIRRDLPNMISDALSRLSNEWQGMANRIEAYRNTPLTDHKAHHLVISGLDHGVYTASRIPDILKEWREPRHDAFQPRTLWSFHNSVTENLKDRIQALPTKTAALNRVCDHYAGLN